MGIGVEQILHIVVQLFGWLAAAATVTIRTVTTVVHRCKIL
jgi:hypothetical protein